jgi:hypothetical protein
MPSTKRSRRRSSPRNPPVTAFARVALLALTLLTVAGCGDGGGPRHPDWVIASKVVFVSEDLRSERAPLGLAQFRLSFPYIAGDLYGAPTTGDFINPAIGTDYAFSIDLNRSQKALLASLEPTVFGQSYLRIAPPEARIARLAPMALEADGIEQIGRTDWVDSDTGRALLLLYVDRAATITGATVSAGRPLRYAISVATPGYVWIGRQTGPDGDMYSVTPRPARLILAIAPPPSGRPTAASRAHTDIPAR